PAEYQSAPPPPSSTAPGVFKYDPAKYKGSEADHKTAQRVARTIVSDIKIYNEKKVVEGRKSKNLYDLLKKEFDHGLKTYEDRIGEVVRAESTYLYDTIVDKLCDGDPSCLGPNFPKNY
ncbi:MAG TPA: hypothetical protein PLL06_01525, partial [Acidobacteriota bacterium]|nr:hypothetical protein [Acidobacteriota bacterium]